MKLALSLLCENPTKKTGLTSLYYAFVERSLAQFPELEWIVYLGENQEWDLEHDRMEIVRKFPANDRVYARLFADHFRVSGDAVKRGADCLVTTGFVPVLRGLPVAMHMLALHHLSHDNDTSAIRRLYRGKAARSGLTRAEIVITNTEFAISQILSVCPEVKDRILQSYEGLDHGSFHARSTKAEQARLQEAFGIEPGYLLWNSNFYPYKQAPLLLEAYADLPKELRSEMPLVMNGGGGWGDGLEVAKAKVAELGLEKSVHFLGWVDDDMIAPLFRNARVFCLPSREETFGRCVLEAMACGTPCVVNDIPVMHEVTAGHAAIVDFADRTASTNALLHVATDEGLRKKFIRDGKKRSKDFCFDKLARERVEAISAMLAERYEKPEQNHEPITETTPVTA